MKFYTATAKTPFSVKNILVRAGEKVYVGKYSEKCYVIGTDSTNWRLMATGDAKNHLKMDRNAQGGLYLAPKHRTPRVTGNEACFKWRVAGGTTCPDGCCGGPHESPEFEEEFSSESEAREFFQGETRAMGKRPHFFQVALMGPGVYDSMWKNPESL